MSSPPDEDSAPPDASGQGLPATGVNQFQSPDEDSALPDKRRRVMMTRMIKWFQSPDEDSALPDEEVTSTTGRKPKRRFQSPDEDSALPDETGHRGPRLTFVVSVP